MIVFGKEFYKKKKKISVIAKPTLVKHSIQKERQQMRDLYDEIKKITE